MDHRTTRATIRQVSDTPALVLIRFVSSGQEKLAARPSHLVVGTTPSHENHAAENRSLPLDSALPLWKGQTAPRVAVPVGLQPLCRPASDVGSRSLKGQRHQIRPQIRQQSKREAEVVYSHRCGAPKNTAGPWFR